MYKDRKKEWKNETINKKKETRIRLKTGIVNIFTVYVNLDFWTASVSNVMILLQQSTYIMSSVYRKEVT
jgi:hypothetical protein